MKKIAQTSIVLITLVLAACGGSGTATREELNDLKPYREYGPYQDVLTRCAQANTSWSSCTLNTLPALAMDSPEPTLEDVLERVVVSHDWMGQRFEQLLEELPDDMLYLLGAVTVIVIDADIRPSYYWKLTGAIYLDPASLWVTLEEKDSINRKLDYRNGNESEMRFRNTGRHIIEGQPAYRYFGLDSTEPRTLDDIVLPMAKLLFHELAHANDHLPRHMYSQIDRGQRISAATDSLHSVYPSTLLKKEMPLTSDLMNQVARVFYHGQTPTEEQTYWTAAQVGDAYAQDGASDIYGYTSQFEDLGMLFEDAMMKIHYNVDRDQAYIEAPEQKYPSCGQQTVSWGQRNRIGDPWVKERVKFVLAKLLPDRDYADRIDALQDPINIPTGTDWCDFVNQGF